MEKIIDFIFWVIRKFNYYKNYIKISMLFL